jgi:transposase
MPEVSLSWSPRSSAEQQARAVAFRAREQLVKQRTEAINALRGHLCEFGHVAPEGIGYVPRLAQVVEDPGSGLPDLARDICRMVLEEVELLTARSGAIGFLSHLRSLRRYDEPEILHFALTSICLVNADAGQALPNRGGNPPRCALLC